MIDNKTAIDVLIFAQILFAMVTIFDWDFVQRQIDKDKANLSKSRFYRAWVGRSFMLLMPTFTIISLLYRPL